MKTKHSLSTLTICTLLLFHGIPGVRADEIDEKTSAFSKALTGGDYAAAVENGEALIAAMRKQADFGDTFASIACLQGLAFAQARVGEPAKADALFREALDFARVFDRMGGDPPQEVVALLKLANHLTETGRYDEAEPLFDEALALQKKAYGETSPEFAEVLNNRGVLRERSRNFEGALADLEAAYRIRCEAGGEDSPEAIDSLWNLSYTTFRSGRMEAALTRLDSYIKGALPLGGGEAARAVEAMELRGRILRDTGNWKEARGAYEAGIAAAAKLFGDESFLGAEFLRGIASIDEKESNLDAAEGNLLKGLEILTNLGKGDDPEAISMRTSLAGVYQTAGRMREAVPILEAVLRKLKEAPKPDHDRLANAYTALGICYGRMRASDRALKTMTAALKENALAGGGADAQERLVLMTNGANALIESGAFAGAAEIHEKVLAVRERDLAPDDRYIAESLLGLAISYENLDRRAEAEGLYLRAIAIYEKRTGAESFPTAMALNNLGDFYRSGGQYGKAVEIGKRVLGIIRATFGDAHRYTAAAYDNLGFAQFGAGDREGALASLRGVMASSGAELADVFAFGTERDRLDYLRSKNPWTLPASLGAARELALLRLRQKGLARDSLIEDRMLAARSDRPEVAAALAELAKAKAALRGAPGDKAAAEALHKAERALTDATRRKSTAREALGLALEDVLAAIPPDTAFIDYVYYERFEPGMASVARFDAVVLRAGQPPVFVPCTDRATIAPLLETYLQCARGITDDATTVEVCRALHDSLVAPLVPHLGEGTRRLVVSPDGLLHRISFATLMPDAAGFLASRFAIQYADSARDLLAESPAVPERMPSITLVGDAAFGGRALAPLPDTRHEAEAIGALAGERNWSVSSLLGADATESALRKAASPTVLHLATHGFYLDEDAVKGARLDPMFRSGIALGGASATLGAWREGRTPEAGNDGILTADEVADLDCSRTWLVALSACDSGTGGLEIGEGVIGLRRGFALAGAGNVVMTLWPVPSAATASFMGDFYAAALESRDPAAALGGIQRRRLETALREKGALQAVSVAGSFILAQRGALDGSGE